MQTVSNDWKAAQQLNFVPLSYVEISYRVTDDAALDVASASDNGHLSISNTPQTLDTTEITYKKYATLEKNIWALNGGYPLYDASTIPDAGFVSSVFSGSDGTFETCPVITISFPSVQINHIPGVTIKFSSAFNEYATDFTIRAYNGSSVVSTISVVGNTAIQCFAQGDISGYNKIEITFEAWNLPYHRCRIEQILLGVIKVFYNKNILGFEHSESVDLLSFELPKAEVSFKMDNVSGEWNPDNPSGVYQYLIERQQITVRYGFKIGEGVEWIKCGTFWLSEWKTPQNGISATFTARDILEFMQNPISITSGEYTLYDLANTAFTQSNLPLLNGAARYVIDNSLSSISCTVNPSNFNYTCAEVVQLCANAACCVCFADRDGVFHITPLLDALTDYEIDQFVSFSNSEYSISKELKSVNVNDGQGTAANSTNGEVQTAKNVLISNSSRANAVAAWIKDVLKNRKIVSGTYRADPRLDALDKVIVTNKYASQPVIITSIKYEYNGMFRGTYEGRVMT